MEDHAKLSESQIQTISENIALALHTLNLHHFPVEFTAMEILNRFRPNHNTEHLTKVAILMWIPDLRIFVFYLMPTGNSMQQGKEYR